MPQNAMRLVYITPQLRQFMRACFLFLVAVCAYAPATSQIQITKLKEGFIIDQYGQKFNGFLAIMRDKYDPRGEQSQVLVYKETLKSKKEKLTVNDVKAFQIENDSFLVLKNFRLPAEDIVHNKFAKVILRGEADLLCTFEHMDLVAGIYQPGHAYTTRTYERYLVYRNGIYREITDHNFAMQMPIVIHDYKSLADEIRSGKLTFKMMNEIVKRYEEWRKGGRKDS
jgi:hypothetical protein